MLCKVVNLHELNRRASSSSELCNLPASIIEKVGGTRASTIILQIVFLSDANTLAAPDDSLYVRWSGEVSSSYPDCIETYEISHAVTSGVVRIGQLHVLENVKEAFEVYVTPDSYFDWEILSSQTEAIERNLLRQVSGPRITPSATGMFHTTLSCDIKFNSSYL